MLQFSRRTLLEIEGLEVRAMLAGDVSVDVVRGNLVVVGEGQANQIEVTAGANPGEVVITAVGDTTVEGGASFTATGVTGNAHFALLAGDDNLNIHDLDIAKNLSILGGTGADTVALKSVDVAYNAAVDTWIGKDIVTFDTVGIGRALSINTGFDDDQVTLTTLSFGSAALLTGSGNDTVALSGLTGSRLSGLFDAGDDVVTLTGAININKASLDGGKGSDTLDKTGATITGTLKDVRFETPPSPTPTPPFGPGHGILHYWQSVWEYWQSRFQ